jgi:hypothetical protein
MDVNLSIAPDGFCAAFMSLNNAFVNTRPGVFEIHIRPPECYRFAWACTLPKLEEYEPVIARPFCSEGFENDLPFLRRIRIDAWLRVGYR